MQFNSIKGKKKSCFLLVKKEVCPYNRNRIQVPVPHRPKHLSGGGLVLFSMLTLFIQPYSMDEDLRELAYNIGKSCGFHNREQSC